MNRLIKQVKAVFLTYLNRRVYQGLILAMLAGFAIVWIASRDHRNHSYIPTVLFGVLISCLMPGSIAAAIVLFFIQARRQLLGPEVRLFPQSRTAHLIAIGILFFAIPIAISAVFWQAPYGTPDLNGKTYWQPGTSPVGAALVAISIMTLAAYVTFNPWLLPFAGAILFLAIKVPAFIETISEITLWLPDRNASTGIGRSFDRLAVTYQWSLRVGLLLANVIALQILVRLARPRPIRPGIVMPALARMIASVSHLEASPIALIAPHVPAIGLLTRGRHRRFAVHSHTAPWVLALGTAVVLTGMMLLSFHASDRDKVLAGLVMLTIIPGVVVAAGWRERWTSLGYESLLPSNRREFITEIAVALAADLIEFWVAALVMTILVLALFAHSALPTIAFAVSIVASAMMQVLWLGAIFLTSRFRQMVPYVVVLVGAGLLMLLPIFHVWTDPLVRTLFLALIALTEMTCGFALLLGGLGLWRKADLA